MTTDAAWMEVPGTELLTPAALPQVVAAPCAALRDPGEASGDALELARALGLSITVADVLFRSGRGANEATKIFLEPRLAHLTPPDAMADRELSADRIARAVRAKERIAVFGDYDCDGITSAAIVTEVLRALGGEVVPLLATRKEGSYGLSMRALARVKATGASLLITCDCGSSDHERLAAARAAGMDVVVIDHHLVPDEPLPALAFLNPHRPECGFPFKGLASCGLALSLGAAVRRALGAQLDMRTWLDLVAIGTVADVAPLVGDNRALVRAGLAVLSQGARPGLRALAELAKVDLPHGVSADDIAFRIAPRINAPGRLGDPDLALELLLERDAARAAGLAATIEQLTVRRRELQEKMVAEALREIDAARWGDEPGIVIAREGWHPGIVGIVAGRIASKYGKPTIAVALEGGSGRGSVRGPSGFPLHDALGLCRDGLVGFGGHQAAAGVEVRGERVEALRALWCAACASLGASLGPVEEPEADVRLDDRDEPAVVARDLERLEPCGQGNRAPRVLVRGAPVRISKPVKGHLKLEVALRRHVIGAFGYELGGLASGLAGGRVDIVGRLRRDTFRGGSAVEMRIERVIRSS
ncbi:single-stranded-DNA-specific exonuclease RecJ [Polyangium aurulentum]|uniref:single-stranded-DNA-specific exonuclease RecJ n=1 Tax=Polyangium aurulentum TaxID=2567896 RepID=UPI0010ADD486|nr:single-stranded-DNA-specific exonuclease RecJ [Polyangium aurulentum]UQA55869.1 single-stranded-DNA-specific exonuclease RecJ [Polyangium aurulentum]